MLPASDYNRVAISECGQTLNELSPYGQGQPTHCFLGGGSSFHFPVAATYVDGKIWLLVKHVLCNGWLFLGQPFPREICSLNIGVHACTSHGPRPKLNLRIEFSLSIIHTPDQVWSETIDTQWLHLKMTPPQNDSTSERLHLRTTPPQNDYLRMTPTQNDSTSEWLPQNDSNSEWLQLRMTPTQNDSTSEWLQLRMTLPQNDSTSEWLYLRMTSVQPLVMSTNTNSRWLSRAAQARCPGFDSQQLPAFTLSPISFPYFVSKSLDSSVRQEFKVPQIGKFHVAFFVLRKKCLLV